MKNIDIKAIIKHLKHQFLTLTPFFAVLLGSSTITSTTILMTYYTGDWKYAAIGSTVLIVMVLYLYHLNKIFSRVKMFTWNSSDDNIDS